MKLAEKIATKPKLEQIDSSIESCLEIIRQEVRKMEAISGESQYTEKMLYFCDRLWSEHDIIKNLRS